MPKILHSLLPKSLHFWLPFTNVLFKTNNLEIIARAAEVLDVPLAVLVGYVNEPDIDELPTPIAVEEKCETDVM